MREEPADRLVALIAASGITTVDAVVDPLTGLIAGPAARHLLDTLLGQWPGAGRARAVTVVDANDLKRVNDEAGHAAGDDRLALIGNLLQATVRDADAFRFGGDEFVIVHTVRRRSAAGDAAAIQTRLRDALGAQAAVGTAAWAGNAPDTLAAADRAMYAHKANQKARR